MNEWVLGAILALSDWPFINLAQSVFGVFVQKRLARQKSKIQRRPWSAFAQEIPVVRLDETIHAPGPYEPRPFYRTKCGMPIANAQVRPLHPTDLTATFCSRCWPEMYRKRDR